MANIRSSDVYLNTLCLAAWAPGAGSLKIAKAVLKMYNETSDEERTMITPLNRLYIKLIREVIDGKLDLSNRSEAQNTLMQYQDDEAFKGSKMSFDELKEMLTPKEAPGQTAIRRLFCKVKNHIVWAENSRRLRIMMMRNMKAGMMDGDEEKQKELLQQIMEDAGEFSEIYNSQNVDDDEPVVEIDFDEPETVRQALKLQHKKRDSDVIKFGWVGVNEMFGERGGACYGEAMAFAGCSHCGKSLILQSLCISHCMYNKPPECGDKRPLILFISLENEAHENMITFYKTLYRNMCHKDPEGMSDDEVIEYLYHGLCKTGFHVKIIRKLGESFGYTEYAKLVDDLEKKLNYKVVSTYLDYVTLCKHESADLDKNDAKQIENMVKRFTDHSNQHGIFFCTAFQLDAEAARIKQSGQTQCVRRFNESCLSDCKGAIKPLDLLFFNDIENNHLGVSYLCFAWRKHRYDDSMPKEKKYACYRFGPLGILFDLHGKPQYTRDMYADDGDNPDGPEQKVDIF